MKRNWLRNLQDQPMDVPELQLWLRRVKTFEEVNWDFEMPDYSTLEALLDLDFEWQWTQNCSKQYHAVVLVTGVVNVRRQTAPGSKRTTLTPAERTLFLESSTALSPRSSQIHALQPLFSKPRHQSFIRHRLPQVVLSGLVMSPKTSAMISTAACMRAVVR
jgi:hypothetical protein